MSQGRVALVGAGPGDPALLTVRAVELLRDAEVVAYDLLVSEAILALVPASAELLPVGRRAGAGHNGYRLHPEVIARARAGKRVVRLKAGDPLIFGRGAEEAEELVAAGIPFEIVPGITAALGAAAYGAIPLTHRDRATEVLVATEHGRGGRQQAPAPAAGRTLVLYMGARHLAANLAAMVDAGWAASTPAALVIAATTSDERTITGTLATLGAQVSQVRPLRDGGDATTDLPALVIVGDVVAARATIDWRANLPLRGRRIVVARARSGPSRVAFALRTAGAEVIELPNVATLSNEDDAARIAALGRLDRLAPARFPARIDLVVLPASAAAEALYAAAPARLRASPAVAIGPRTEEAARRIGVHEVTRATEDSIDALVEAAIRALDPATPPPLSPVSSALPAHLSLRGPSEITS